MRFISRLAIRFVLVVLLLAGCSASREARYSRIAADAGFETGSVQVDEYALRYYLRQDTGDSTRLTIYLEGDGSPWATPTRIARDPTARQPTALELMSEDRGNTLYVARPCYHLADASGCDPTIWTGARYSTEVVTTMTSAIQALLPRFEDIDQVRLVGHSGGGVLAVLIAEQLPRVTEVITIAANLDVAKWANHHRYSALSESANPAVRKPLRSSIRQLHLYGAEDTNVPVELARTYFDRQSEITVAVFPQFDHQCCWRAAWSKVLAAATRWTHICATLQDDNPKIDCMQPAAN